MHPSALNTSKSAKFHGQEWTGVTDADTEFLPGALKVHPIYHDIAGSGQCAIDAGQDVGWHVIHQGGSLLCRWRAFYSEEGEL